MKKRILTAVSLLFICLIAAMIYLWTKSPAKNLPQTIDSPSGFVKAHGAGIYDGEGKLLRLKGVNLGDWFVQEGYMGLESTESFEPGYYTQSRSIRAMEANPNLSDEQREELYNIYMSTFIQEQDFKNIADLGLNVVRINFTYRNLTDDEGNFRKDAFRYLDWSLEMCEKYGIYAILDLHGAYGSQNQDHHSGDDTQLHLYDSEKNRELTKTLWKTLAERYKDRTCIAGYDLLNECRKAKGHYGGKINTDFYYELYETIREVDSNHMIFIEYFSFPINGARLSGYDWDNICVEYHIYNLTWFTQLQCIGFYNALNNFMGVKVPVFIGEWSCWDRESDWKDSIDYFEEHGWSYASWTYKANRYLFDELRKEKKFFYMINWGLVELDCEPIDVHSATFEELKEFYQKVGTEYAEKTLVYDIYTLVK